MQPQLRKACPRCQTPTSLMTACCVYCGHQYRTRFVPPLPVAETVQPTRKLSVAALEIRDMSAKQAALGLAAAIALSGLIWMAMPNLSGRSVPYSRADKLRKEKTAPSPPPVTADSPQTRFAEVKTR